MKKITVLMFILILLISPLSVRIFGADNSTAPSYQYIDKDSGALFTVPDGWKEVPLTSSEDIFSIKFTNSSYPDYYILFGAVDGWDALSDAQKERISREEFDKSSDYLDEDFKIALKDRPKTSVKRLRINNELYVELDFQDTKTPSKTMVCLKNGWYYTFGFFGKETTIIHPDFRALLESVTYPVTESAVTTEKAETTKVPASTSKVPSVTSKVPAATYKSPEITSDTPNSDSIQNSNTRAGDLLYYFMLLLLSGSLIYLLPLVLFRFLIYKKPISYKASSIVSIVWLFASSLVFLLIVNLITGNKYRFDFKIGALWMILSPMILSAGYKQFKEESVREVQLGIKHQNRREIAAFLRIGTNVSSEERSLIDSFEYLTSLLAAISVDTSRKNRKENKERSVFLENELSKLISDAQFKKLLKNVRYDEYYITDFYSAVMEEVYLVTRSDTVKASVNTRSASNGLSSPDADTSHVLKNAPQLAYKDPRTDSLHGENAQQSVSTVISEHSDASDKVKPAETDHPSSECGSSTAPSFAKDEPLWCRMCGVRLESDSDFCHKCGTKVIR